MKHRTTATLAAIFALMLIHTAYATFPYSAKWLNYADKRLVYQIDTSSITSNTANIYVTISIDPSTLQDYINKWSDYCDPTGKYDWFYITPYYVSTKDNSPRRMEVIEFDNWQTFTVGSCGTVDLPTSYVLKLPNGVLDGGDSYANYQHYVLAYLKYPYSEDAADNLSGILPEEYNIIDTAGVSNTGNISFGSGGTSCNTRATRPIDIDIDLSSKTPVMFCFDTGAVYHSWDNSCINIRLSDNSTYQFTGIGTRCFDLRDYLQSAGKSGNLRITQLEFGRANVHWYWIVPQSIYTRIVRG